MAKDADKKIGRIVNEKVEVEAGPAAVKARQARPRARTSRSLFIWDAASYDETTGDLPSSQPLLSLVRPLSSVDFTSSFNHLARFVKHISA